MILLAGVALVAAFACQTLAPGPEEVAERYYQAVLAGNPDDAYPLTTPAFQEVVPKATYVRSFQMSTNLEGAVAIGKRVLDSDDTVVVQVITQRGRGRPVAMDIRLEKGQEGWRLAQPLGGFASIIWDMSDPVATVEENGVTFGIKGLFLGVPVVNEGRKEMEVEVRLAVANQSGKALMLTSPPSGSVDIPLALSPATDPALAPEVRWGGGMYGLRVIGGEVIMPSGETSMIGLRIAALPDGMGHFSVTLGPFDFLVNYLPAGAPWYVTFPDVQARVVHLTSYDRGTGYLLDTNG